MRLTRLAGGLALAATLILPLFLLYGRAVAEVMIAITDICFLARSAAEGQWGWLRSLWLRIGLAWWAWLVICSLPFAPFANDGMRPLGEALATVRFLVFIAALEHFVLTAPAARRWLSRSLALAFLWIGVESLQQYFTGRNIFGHPINGDGELTGPFDKARAGPPFSRLFFPLVLPPVDRLLVRAGILMRAAGVAVMLAAVAVQVLIGQRMPVLLMGLGLFVTFLLMRRLRVLMVVCAVGAVALVGAAAVIRPPAYYRLVEKFTRQMSHFRESPYGELYVRSAVMAKENLLLGRGFDGYRDNCREPRYFHDLTFIFTGHDRPGYVSKGASVCNEEPGNFYLQAATDSGIPGLLLYVSLGLAWLVALGRGLGGGEPDPTRVGLFVAALIFLWPLASTSSYLDMPMSGWSFLLIGWGLAEARAIVRPRAEPGG
ncbi:MAG TPA: O-antigen ligase family protein [Acetobacteraceae bacterium]|nr:O-antigen ligase family protein [Acetobacteraceae bacterium]